MTQESKTKFMVLLLHKEYDEDTRKHSKKMYGWNLDTKAKADAKRKEVKAWLSERDDDYEYDLLDINTVTILNPDQLP